MSGIRLLSGGLLVLLLFTAVLTVSTAPVSATEHCSDNQTAENDSCTSSTSGSLTKGDYDSKFENSSSDSGDISNECFNGVCHEGMLNAFNQLANFIILIVTMLAVPNGAYGFSNG